jgi:hypothetical protein
MRPTVSTFFIAAVAMIGLAACASSSNAAANAADATATTVPADNSAAAPADNAAATDAPAASDATPPIYPGAVKTARPKGVVDKAPPQAVFYQTADGFDKVRAWYKASLKGAPELGAPDNDKTKDVFLYGSGKSGMVIMLQNSAPKTWIIVGPATP